MAGTVGFALVSSAATGGARRGSSAGAAGGSGRVSLCALRRAVHGRVARHAPMIAATPALSATTPRSRICERRGEVSAVVRSREVRSHSSRSGELLTGSMDSAPREAGKKCNADTEPEAGAVAWRYA